jgi:prepilin-type N-terminal cleavage/methylation domain-containing protein
MISSRDYVPRPCRGFTLVELLVTIVIISILASLTLAGLAGVRQRGKIEKTRSTIRKLHEIVMPQYESYLTQRVQLPPALTGTGPYRKLKAIRALIAQEMPDQWLDVFTPSTISLPHSGGGPVISPATAPTRRYAALKGSISGIPASPTIYGSAECLFMVVARSGFAAEEFEFFRADEVTDINNNGAPEFADGWGRPIAFIRWPAGFQSIAQPPDVSGNPDPFDPMRVSGDYGLVPLIFSGGPDESLNPPLGSANGYDVQTFGPWLGASADTLLATTRQGSPLLIGTAGSSARDNITNHDLMSKR